MLQLQRHHLPLHSWQDLARVLLDQLTPTIAEQTLSMSQCSLLTSRRTVDTIFVLYQLKWKCWEHNIDLYVAFNDLTKAFDMVS